MSYVAIPSNLKNVNSVSLQLMSPEEMTNMSYGEVLTAETINYRTGAPQPNGLFCQAIFGPVKDWECACGKYKRYRYAGVICDKCGVEVTHSSVRRERMGHISLAAPCVHPWFLRVIPSRIALLLNMKANNISKVVYFSAYVITEINEDIRAEYLEKIEAESQNRIKNTKADFDKRFDDLSRQYQRDKAGSQFDPENLKIKYETDKEILKTQQAELVAKIEAIAEVAKKELVAMEQKDVITEVMYQELSKKFAPVFKAGIGADAIETLLRKIDLQSDFDSLKEKITTSKGQNKKKLIKQFKLVKSFLQNDARPEWMILKRVMVLPPDLRPMLQLDGGRFAASDLNELYRRLINRNNRLRKLIEIGAPEVILRNEKRMLQEAIEALIDNSARGGKQVMASTGIKRALKSLTDSLKGKSGRFRQNLLGKRVDYSGRSVVIVGPSLKLDQCGLPKEMALELFKPFLMGRIMSKSEAGLLSEEYQCFNIHSARRLIESKKSIVYDILDEVIADKYVLLNRAPTLHRLSFLAFRPILVEGKAIRLHPLACRAFNADFDGDQMAVHLPITIKGQDEAKNLMVATRNLLKPASGELIMSGGTLDIILGSYYLTMASDEPEDTRKIKRFSSASEALIAFEHGAIKLNDIIIVRMKLNPEKPELLKTTMGRIIFNKCFPKGYPFVNLTLTKKEYEKTLNQAYFALGSDAMAEILDTIKDLAFKHATSSGVSLSVRDFISPPGKAELIVESKDKVNKVEDLFNIGMVTEPERYKQVVSVWRDTCDQIAKMTESVMDPISNVGVIIKSGARSNFAQLNHMAGIRGMSVTASGQIIELPAVHSYLEGLTGLEYFIQMKGQRKGQADISLKTADAGYLTRRLVDVAQNMIIMNEDCGTNEGILITDESAAQVNKTIWDQIYGRYLAKDIIFNNEVLAKRNELLDHSMLSKMQDLSLTEAWVRSSTKCELPRGVCRHCYGIDFSTHKPVQLGVPVGIVGAQSLGENSTQLTMNQGKHMSGQLLRADITQGIARVEEIFEARTPKYTAPISYLGGMVSSVEGNVEQGFKIVISSQVSTHTLAYNGSQDLLQIESGQPVASQDVLIIKPTGEIVRSGYNGVVQTEGDKLLIKQTNPETLEITTLPGYYLLVKKGDKIEFGDPITEGPINLQEVLDFVGLDKLQRYLTNELTSIYIANGINVNEKHIEVIIKQMCNRAQIIDSGETDFVIGDLVRVSTIININKKMRQEGKRIATFKRTIVGISRSSLSTDSFLSAASFQETSKVLVEAVISGKPDYLLGLKENVILGQLIPAGTGFDSNKARIALEEQLDEEFEETEAEIDLEEVL